MFTFLSPPVAFAAYLFAVLLIMGFGRTLAGPSLTSIEKQSSYAGGEQAPWTTAVQGYSSGFLVALFFGVLHLGVLVVATATQPALAGLFVLGLFVALLVLWLE